MSLPLDFARGLRTEATPEERMLWRILAGVRPRFTRQYWIGLHVADFACRRVRVLVELDGSQHVESKRDVARDEVLEADGWLVVRFWNNDVLRNAEGIVTAIIHVAKDRLPPGESFAFVNARPARTRKKKEEPPPAPPANAEGE